MKKINEEFLHFLWSHQHLAGVSLLETSDHRIRVISPGEHNTNAGPDFFNAKIEIDDTVWAGNVELHVNASDWLRHNHQHDPAYDSVILHVVYYHDCEITVSGNRTIPAVTIRFPVMLWEKYEEMMKSKGWIPCQQHLRAIEPVHFAQWSSSLLVERLQQKCELLETKFKEEHMHWDALLSREIFRCFGLPVNVLPFEMLAMSIPYPTLLREKQSLHTLEAILFGRAGLLTGMIPDDVYMEGLGDAYMLLSQRFDTPGVGTHMWKYSRMRPSSFPAIRIAQLAGLIHNAYPMLGNLEPMPTLSQLHQILKCRAGDYWSTHNQFGKISSNHLRYTGDDFINRLIINAIVPFLFFYGRQVGRPRITDYAIMLLEEIPAEANQVTKKWIKFGLQAANAFESQALLFLYKSYCRKKRCLECQFGNNLLLHGKEHT